MRNNWKIAAALVVGLIVGYASSTICSRHRHSRWGSEKSYERILERFNSKLNLTPEQKSQVSAILQTSREKIKALQTDIHPKFEEIRNSTNAEIRKILTPDQQKKFDEMQAAWKAKWEKRRANRDK